MDTVMEEVSAMEGEAIEEAMGEGMEEAIAVDIVGAMEVTGGMVETIMGEEGTEEIIMVAGDTEMTMVVMEDMEMIMEAMVDMVTTTRVDW